MLIHEKQKVTNKIDVGNHPHSVVLSEDGTTAYVSNQWSDNVSVINLSRFVVTDTLTAGSQSAGLAISADGKYLYTVNSISSNLSVIDISAEMNKKAYNRK